MLGIREEAFDEYPMEGVVRRILSYNDYIMVMEGHLVKGFVVDHKHPHMQSTYLVSGEMEAWTGSEKRILHAGDVMIAEPNQQHGVRALTDVTLIDTFTPCREDYIPQKKDT